MLDTNTGELSIDAASVKLGPRFRRQDLKLLGIDFRSQVVNEPHHSYSLGEQEIGGELFKVTLYFFGQKLESIDMSLASPDFCTSRGSHSEGSEMKLLADHDAWLIRQTGRASHKYLWGEIVSAYDPRSGGSSITIRYSWLGRVCRSKSVGKLYSFGLSFALESRLDCVPSLCGRSLLESPARCADDGLCRSDVLWNALRHSDDIHLWIGMDSRRHRRERFMGLSIRGARRCASAFRCSSVRSWLQSLLPGSEFGRVGVCGVNRQPAWADPLAASCCEQRSVASVPLGAKKPR